MIFDQFRLDGKVAMVTGASHGLGQAMAWGLAQAGADVVNVSRRDTATETRSLVEGEHRRFGDYRADLGNAEDRAGLVQRAVADFGRLDILINNAGNCDRFPPEEYPLENWQQLLNVHLSAAFDLSQQAGHEMLPRGAGKIINIGSVLSFEGGLNIPAYAAAKHALAGLTKSLATAWAGQGINVNCIAPGYFDTDPPNSLRHDPVRAGQILDRIPCNRWGLPDEIAPLAVFLASDASSYMHGSIIPIDGGWLAR